MRVNIAIEASTSAYVVEAAAGSDRRSRRQARRSETTYPSLSDMTASVLQDTGATFQDIQIIAVDIGPGNLSSVRAAVSYANGLAASLGVPILAMNSLEMMAIEAWQSASSPVLALRKSTAGMAYAGVFTPGREPIYGYASLGAVAAGLAADTSDVVLVGDFRARALDLLGTGSARCLEIESPSVSILSRMALARPVDVHRLTSIASPINEGARIFHERAAVHDSER